VGEFGSFIEVEDMAKSVVLIGVLLKGFLRRRVPTRVAAIGFDVGVGVTGLESAAAAVVVFDAAVGCSVVFLHIKN
jgi:hypothetical protein